MSAKCPTFCFEILARKNTLFNAIIPMEER